MAPQKSIILLLAALALPGCTGPVVSSMKPTQNPIAWDGAGNPPSRQMAGEETPRKPRVARDGASRQVAAQSNPLDAQNNLVTTSDPKPFSPEWQAQEQAEAAHMKKTLAICSNC
jgi:hypothetical protein